MHRASPSRRHLCRARHVRFCQALDYPVSLDEHPRKFLTTSASTGQPDLAPALVQQGLQPIRLKRQRLNPSGVCQGFRQGLSIVSPSPAHSGRVHADRRWSTSRAPSKLPLPRHSICWLWSRSVQSLSRIRASALDGTVLASPSRIGPGQARQVIQRRGPPLTV
ncbi:hypothetical protein D3C80_1686780 [compost metagenome]